MKKQNNSVSIMSMKSRISATVLCAFLGATEVNASNYLSADLNTISKEVKAEPKNENGMNRNSTWTANNDDEADQEQILEVIERWMSDSSYWSIDETWSNDQKISDCGEKEMNSENTRGNLHNEIKKFKFNAESYIPNSEF